MSHPSREQVAQSREYVAGLLESHAIKSMMSGAEITAIKDLLAATAEPSEQELAEKAARFACAATQQEPEPRDTQDVLDEYKDPTDERTVFGWIACAYIAGARGEEPR